MSSRRRAVLVWLAGLGLALMLSLPVGCVDHSDAWKAAECIPDEPDKPPCPSGTICLKDDWSCHSLCEQSSSECESPVEGCFLPDGVCKVYRAECDPANPSCMEGFYCDSSGACTKKIGLGSKCTDAGECWSGVCQDGFCCTSCQESCSACAEELTGRPSGTCAFILAGKKRGDQDCPDPLSCNGAGQCETRGLGEPCTEAEHCTSGFCADEVCCDALCSGVCEACVEAETGAASGACLAVQANLDPHDECPAHLSCSGVAGACFDLGVGEACTDNGQCLSGHCTDGVCCETACNGICESCLASKTGGTNGSCDPIPNGADPDVECSGSFGCSGSRACISGAANGVACGQDGQCESGHCVDGVCCAAACGACLACIEGRTGMADGACGPIPEPFDPDGDCLENGGFGCNGAGVCNPEKTWSTPTRIEESSGGVESYVGFGVDVAVDGSGNAIAVWAQHTGSADTPSVVRANRYVRGVGWGVAQTIQADTARDSTFPVVAVNAAGNAVAAWAQTDGTTIKMWASRYIVGHGWQAAETIDTAVAGDAITPDAAVNDAGDAFVVWEHRLNVDDQIWANRFEAGVGWTGAVVLEENDQAVEYPAVAVNAAGDALVAWVEKDGTFRNASVARYTPAGGWEAPATLSNQGDDDVDSVAIDMNAAGDGVAVWSEFDGSVGDVWASSYTRGAWGVARVIASSGLARILSVAIAGNGSAVAVWRAGDILANRFLPGHGWGDPMHVATSPGRVNGGEVGVDAAGNAVAVWPRKTTVSGPGQAMANRLVAAGEWGTPVQVNTGLDGAYIPRIDVSPNGEAVMVWYQGGDAWSAVLR